MRYAFIHQERVNYPVRVMCRVMQVSVCRLYHWRGRPPSARSLEQTRVLGQCFATTTPAEAWDADITYIDTD